MKLSTVIRQARNGELSAMSSNVKTNEVITDYINLGLIALYKRFPLRTDEAIVTLRTGKTLYRLDGTDEDVSMGAGELYMVTSAFDEVGPIPVNDDSVPFGIFTTSYNVVQIPIAVDGSFVSIMYQTGPDEIIYDEATVDSVDVPLPSSLVDVLLTYIDYRATKSSTPEGSGEPISKYRVFQAACNEAEKLGLVPSDHLTFNTDIKGFA